MTAQGVLINMICLMHQSKKYGYLLINGSKPDHKTIIKLLRTHHKTFISSVNQLLLCGALKQTKEGIYYCERMVKDEHIRQVRRKAGLKGGNPNLKKGKPNPYYLDKQKDKQKITPSSSSSSSSSKKNKYSVSFETFYKKYPIKKSKDPAFKNWEKLNREKQLPELKILLDAIEQQKKEKEIQINNNQFCPEWKHPSTWLYQKCWEDEVDLDIKSNNPYELKFND